MKATRTKVMAIDHIVPFEPTLAENYGDTRELARISGKRRPCARSSNTTRGNWRNPRSRSRIYRESLTAVRGLLISAIYQWTYQLLRNVPWITIDQYNPLASNNSWIIWNYLSSLVTRSRENRQNGVQHMRTRVRVRCVWKFTREAIVISFACHDQIAPRCCTNWIKA